jgi:DNA (cytosine-5)-methyltransferase 1
MNVLDLFSGIGGFSLGLERAGMRTVAFCEIEPFCRAVLRKHWPNVPIYEDVRSLTAERLAADGIAVDVICGGFPCQDISLAGKGAGIEGERSGLWKEYARIIGELRPKYVIVENVAALLGRGLDVVLGDLAALGYDAEWHCIPASAVGAPHRRDRLWIVANHRCGRLREPCGRQIQQSGRTEVICSSQDVADAIRLRELQPEGREQDERRRTGNSSEDVSHAECARLQGFSRSTESGTWRSSGIAAGIHKRLGGQWLTEPDVGRVADGVSHRLHRLKGLGNAVVPQIPEIIGRAIMAASQAFPLYSVPRHSNQEKELTVTDSSETGRLPRDDVIR